MYQLNLPSYEFKIRKSKADYYEILDEIRKKYLKLTPEEWVRQNFIKYLNINLGYSAGLLGIEQVVKINNMSKRADIIVFDTTPRPVMIVECKSPDVKINQHTVDQAIKYNYTLKVDYIVLTNGLSHYCYYINYTENSHRALKSIPTSAEIIK